jgi:hypothetical protein
MRGKPLVWGIAVLEQQGSWEMYPNFHHGFGELWVA